ncbi:MAG: glutamine-synthetase adenylyltransferase, partial [Sphingomonadales bacterium]
IMDALIRAPDPEAALARFDNMIESLPSAVNFFHLLDARPGLLKLLADVLSYAPTLANALARRSEYLEGLIDASAFELPSDKADLVAELDARLGDADYERLLDLVRAFVGEKRFAFGVQLIEGRHDPLDVSRAYAQLAEVAVCKLTAATIAEFENAHGRVPGGEFIILAYGRLGGQSLTHASDLDLVLLFTGETGAESDGRRPLGATQYFNRLAQRVVGALSVQTASGALYEIDTRLRPSGAQGMLCVSVESFAHYQREEAWTWEHMALTRARVVFGPSASVDAVIAEILGRDRAIPALHKDIAAMRAEMAEHKPPKGALDVKLCPGGLVDAEFCIHALQLEHRKGIHPQLQRAVGELVATGLLPPAFADAEGLLTRLLVLLRLVAPDSAVPPAPVRALVARALDYADWTELMAAVDTAKAAISAVWKDYKEKVK